MSIGGIVSGIGSVFGANEQVKGQKVAQDMYTGMRKKYQPFVEGGMEGFDEFQKAVLGIDGAGYEDFMQRPDIQYQIDQGIKGATQGLAGAGMLNSGRGMMELQGVGQDIAGQGFQQYLQNLSALSGYGMDALDRQTGLTGQMADSRIGVGQARAGRSQAIGDLAGDVAGSMMGGFGGSKPVGRF